MAASATAITTVTILRGDKIVSLHVALAETTVETLLQMACAETGTALDRAVLRHEQRDLSSNLQQTLAAAGVGADAVLELVERGPMTLQTMPAHLWNDPVQLQTFLRQHPNLLEQLQRANRDMYDCVMADGPQRLIAWLAQQQQARVQEEERRFQEQLRRQQQFELDPLNPEHQASMYQEIQQTNINANYEAAVEHNPESFGTVVMLYVPMVVNGISMTAFVDSGAQSTIMSVECAERCNLMRLVDKRFAGMAKGVGTCKIVGRVHSVPVRIGTTNFACSFTILEQQGKDFLFGLDQLKRHQACIDLKDNVLRIGGEAIPFLAEKDLPKDSFIDERGEIASSPTNSSSSSSSSSAAAPAPAPTPAPLPAAAPAPAAASSAPVPAPSAAPAAGGAAGAGAAFSEASITACTNLGATRQQAIEALTLYAGNAEQAASHIFSMLNGF